MRLSAKSIAGKGGGCPSKTELFSTSIRENIEWGALGAEEKAIKTASCTAQADDFICATSDGYDTIVAKRGMSLSGGLPPVVDFSGLDSSADALAYSKTQGTTKFWICGLTSSATPMTLISLF